MLVYAFWLGIIRPTVASGTDTSLVSTQVVLPTATATSTPFLTPTLSAPLGSGSANVANLPTSSPIPTNLPPTPPSGGLKISLTPPADSVGWTSSLDGKSQFNDGKIHAGFFKGHVFHGAIQFDLSALPPGSNIAYAALQLTGLSDKNLDLGGVWQVRLLDTPIGDAWATLTYDKLRQASVQSTLQPALPRASLASDQANVFVFNDEQLWALEQRLDTGLISFRIDGPSTGLDNLFTWDGGLGDEIDTAGEVLTPGEQTPLTRKPVLEIVVESVNYVIVTSTPTPENILTRAAQLSTDTTPTPLPAHWVTPIIVTSTPTPASLATATYQAQLATAEAVVYGTATPVPPNLWTATPEPVLIYLPDGIPPSLPSTPIPAPIPEILVGKIAFLSDRAGQSDQNSQPLAYVMDGDGSNIFLLTDRTVYDRAVARDKLAAGQQFLAFEEYVEQNDGSRRPAIFFYDYTSNSAEQVTRFESSLAYQPAWSPIQERITFVADDSGTEEIWVINRDGSNALQLTRDDPNALDRHPSWSPDASQIVFWSNRTGQAQIWIMSADGSNQRILHQSNFNDWNPVWIKYTDVVTRSLPGEKFVPN